MSYLPIIRFKNRWQTFDLNLHYPYSVNGKIINYTHLGYRGDACYIVDNEYNTYYLPHDYAEIINDALKISDNSFLSPFPKEKVKKREVDELSALFKNRNIATRPPITPQIPKSSTPRAFNTTREVYNDTIIDIPIRIYRKIVFLAIIKFFSLIILLLRYRIMSPTIH